MAEQNTAEQDITEQDIAEQEMAEQGVAVRVHGRVRIQDGVRCLVPFWTRDDEGYVPDYARLPVGEEFPLEEVIVAHGHLDGVRFTVHDWHLDTDSEFATDLPGVPFEEAAAVGRLAPEPDAPGEAIVFGVERTHGERYVGIVGAIRPSPPMEAWRATYPDAAVVGYMITPLDPEATPQ